MATNGNDSAFPGDGDMLRPSERGLTKRELFAAMAMHAMMANPACADMSSDEVFIASVNSADRLIAKLSKAAQ